VRSRCVSTCRRVDLERLAAAQTEAVEALESGLVFPRAVAGIRSRLALAAIARGNWSDALSLADAGIASPGFWAISTTEARLARAEALRGLGRFEEARESIAALRRQLLAQADAYAHTLDGAAYRKRQHVASPKAMRRSFQDTGTHHLRGEEELTALHVPGDELLVDVPAKNRQHELGDLDDLIVVGLRHLRHPALGAARTPDQDETLLPTCRSNCRPSLAGIAP
jgi:hypothetical protein